MPGGVLREKRDGKIPETGYLSNGVLLTFAQHFGVHQERSWSLMIPFEKLWMMLPEARTLFCLRFQSEICWSLFEQLDQLLFVREPLQQMVDVMGLYRHSFFGVPIISYLCSKKKTECQVVSVQSG